MFTLTQIKQILELQKKGVSNAKIKLKLKLYKKSPYEHLLYEEIHHSKKECYLDWLKEDKKLYKDYKRWKRWLSGGRI
jgi:hypothetical protein